MAGFLDVQVTANGVREAAGRFSGAAVGEMLAQAVEQWASTSVMALREATPVRTGEMQKGWRAEQGDLSAAITNPVPWALVVIGGSKPHEIRPRDPAGYLRFMVGDETVYARAVRHPGTRANERLGEVLEQRPAAAEEAVAQAVERLMRTLGGA